MLCTNTDPKKFPPAAHWEFLTKILTFPWGGTGGETPVPPHPPKENKRYAYVRTVLESIVSRSMYSHREIV